MVDGKASRKMVDEETQSRCESVRAGEPLCPSEEDVQLALAGAGMGYWEWDLRTDMCVWDPQMRELLGVGRSLPATSENFFRLVDLQDGFRVRRLIEVSAAAEDVFHAEFRIHRPSSRKVVWLSLRGMFVRDRAGRAERVLGIAYDITQNRLLQSDLGELSRGLEERIAVREKQLTNAVDQYRGEVMQRVLTEQALEERSQMLEAFFQHAITPLAFLDRGFNFVRVNQAYAEAVGRDPEDFAGRNYFELQARDGDRAIFAEVVRTKQPYSAQARPLANARNAGRPVAWWDWLLTPLLNGDGEVEALVLNLEDVTEQRKAFFELEHRARQLQDLVLEVTEAEDRERRRVAEILHDDLQQILAGAKFHLSVLDSGARSPAEVREIVQQVKEMLKEAIEKSRSLSHELNPAVLHQGDLRDMLDWLARQMHAQHGLTVHMEVRGRLELRSEGLKVFLYRTIQELLFNVVKHARTDEAKIRVQGRGRYLCLSVSDRGRGFDPRQQGSAAGFGLMRIRERIELLGGRLKIKSAEGRGSTFRIVVPYDRSVATSAQGGGG